MTDEEKNEDQFRKIESQLFQIKLLLIIIADLCILGFYGLTRSLWDDIHVILTQIWEVFIVIGFIATFVLSLIWFVDWKKGPKEHHLK